MFNIKTTKINIASEFFKKITENNLYSNVGNLQFHTENLFNGIIFEHKRVLDIGGGKGIISFYANIMGAKEVICLEPEYHGSSIGMIKDFQRMTSIFNAQGVSLKNQTFQEFNSGNKKFDIIILRNSINHLDEPACINLKKNQEAKAQYQKIFQKIYALLNPNGVIIVADCSGYNFFNLLNIRNPFAPSIEWHKHQSPKIWIQLLKTAGFQKAKVKWLSLSTFGKIGQKIFGNKIIAYFTHSHFIFQIRKPL